MRNTVYVRCQSIYNHLIAAFVIICLSQDFEIDMRNKIIFHTLVFLAVLLSPSIAQMLRLPKSFNLPVRETLSTMHAHKRPDAGKIHARQDDQCDSSDCGSDIDEGNIAGEIPDDYTPAAINVDHNCLLWEDECKGNRTLAP